MTSPTPDFEAALDAQAESYTLDAMLADPDGVTFGNVGDRFSDGARWARSWVLANDPLVREIYEAALALRNTCMDGELYGDHDKSVALIARVTQALAAYRESVSVKEGGDD